MALLGSKVLQSSRSKKKFSLPETETKGSLKASTALPLPLQVHLYVTTKAQK